MLDNLELIVSSSGLTTIGEAQYRFGEETILVWSRSDAKYNLISSQGKIDNGRKNGSPASSIEESGFSNERKASQIRGVMFFSWRVRRP